MKLRRLALSNIRLHRASEFYPGPGVNILHGPVGQGKTTIGQILEWALSDRCDWLPGGKNTEALISAQAQRGTATVEFFDNLGEIRQFEKSIPSSDGIKALQASIYQTLGVNELVLTACLRPGGFFAMEPDKQRMTLWSVLGEVSDTDVYTRLNDYNSELPKLGEYYYKSLIPGALSMVRADDHHKHIQNKLLPAINTEVATMEGKLAATPPHNPEDLYSPSVHDEVRMAHRAAEAEIAKFEVFRSALATWTTLKAAHDAAQAEIPGWIERLNQLQAREQELLALREEHPLEPVIATIKELEGERLRLEREIAALPAAPFDDATTACPKGKCVRAEVQEWRKNHDKQLARLTEARDAVVFNLVDLEAAQAVVLGREAELTGLTEKMAELVTTEPHPVDPGERPEGDEDGLMALVKKSGEAAMNLARHDVLHAHMTQVAKQMAQRAADQQHLEERKRVQKHLLALKDALGPRGVRADIMENKVRAFIDVVNLHLHGLGPAIAIDQTTWEVRGIIQGKAIPVALMSDSQIQRQSLCVQAELALRTGLGLVVMDRCAEMGPGEVRDCCAFLLSKGLQAILMRTTQELTLEETVAKFDMPGVDQFLVSKGTVVQLTGAAVVS